MMSAFCKYPEITRRLHPCFYKATNSTLVLCYQLVVPIIHVWVSIPHVMFMSAPNAPNCRERLLWDMQEGLFCFVIDDIIFCALCTIFGQFARKSCIQVALRVVFCVQLPANVNWLQSDEKEGRFCWKQLHRNDLQFILWPIFIIWEKQTARHRAAF